MCYNNGTILRGEIYMSKYYGIYLKGKVKEPLDLTKLTNFERSGNLKSNKLYTG